MTEIKKEGDEMYISNIWINGLENPIGYDYNPLIISWRVSGGYGERLRNVSLEIATDEEFQDSVYLKEDNMQSSGVKVDLDLKPRTKYYVRIIMVTIREKSIGKTCFFETGKMEEKWDALWIGYNNEQTFHPTFSKGFTLNKKIQDAKLYICGLGLYEAYLNSEKIGDEVLTPFINDYDSFLQVQTYDVTNQIKEKNILSIHLGDGWYKGRFGLQGNKNIFGNQFTLIAELIINYCDGTQEKIVTNKTWKCTNCYIVESGIYDGEYIDKNTTINSYKTVVLDMDYNLLKDRLSTPLKMNEEINVKQIIYTSKDEVVLDFGQNFAGWITFTNQFNKGHKVLFEFGEILQNNCFYNDNYKSATKGFTYVSDGTYENVRPHFTYYGFRYVRVTGWNSVGINDVKGIAVYSNLERTGYLETGNDKVNQLYSNVLWSMKSNFVDMPTDCPQRDERLGWTGDAQVFAPTASYYFDTRAFYRKFLYDLECAQHKYEGSIPEYIPAINAKSGSSVWGDVATFIPYEILRKYNCIDEISQYYGLMKKWVDKIGSDIEKVHGTKSYLNDCHFEFGDWLALDGVLPTSFKGGTDEVFIASVYYCESLRIVSEFAGILGKSEDKNYYFYLCEIVKENIFREFFTETGRLSIDTQTAYIISLRFNIYIKKDVIIEQFKKRLKKDLYKIKTGFVGTPLFCQTLAENGMSDIAYDLLLQEDYPSWLYAVNLGATTIWERWNSVLPNGEINSTGMNSLNHYSYGSVIEFLYKYSAGIQASKYGFSNFVLAPLPNSKLKYINSSYNSMNGKIVSNWKILETGELELYFEVPFNTKATIILPYSNEKPISVESGQYSYKYIPNKDLLSIYDVNTRINVIKKDQGVFKELLKVNSTLSHFIDHADEEQLNLSILEVSNLFYTGVSKEALEKCKKFFQML